MRRRPLAIGWLGHGNFGDEAMAYALRGALRQRGIGMPTYYLRGSIPLYHGPDEAALMSLHAGERPKSWQRLLDVFLLRPYDVVVIGGGSILHSLNSIAWKLKTIERVTLGKPQALVASVGVSIGPLADAEAERLCAAYLEKNDLVIVRDMASARTAARLSPQTRVLASRDLSFALPGIDPDAWKAATSGVRHARMVAVSFVWRDDGQPIRKEDSTVRRYRAILDNLLKDGWSVRLCTLYTGHGYRDAELNELLRLTATQPERVTHHVFNGDIYSTVAMLHSCSAMISMRLHAIIFAYLLGIPFVALEYHRKQADFCETMQYPMDLVLRPDAETTTVLAAFERAVRYTPFTGAEPIPVAAKHVNDALDAFVRLAL